MAQKLIIVDDQRDSRYLVHQAACSPADTVLEFNSPEEALKVLDVFQPNCVMLGLSHPTPDTFQAIQTIRRKHPAVRVLVVSDFNQAELREAASAAGATAYVNSSDLSELYLLAAPERLAELPIPRTAPTGKRLGR